YVLLRVLQLWTHKDDPSPALLGALLVLIFLAAAIYAGLKVRHRLTNSGSVRTLARELGWRWAPTDGGSVGRRYRQRPVLAARRKGESAHTKQVVWGIAGERRWWAVDGQAYLFLGARGSRRDVRRTMQRACVIVALPGVWLPTTVVAGKDMVGIREWFS